MKTLSIVVVAAAVVLSTGCWQKKKKPVVVPPPPAPVTQPAPVPAPKATIPAVEKPTPSKPTAQRPKVQPASRPQVVAPAPPVPQLGAMIPAAQRQQLDAIYALDLKKARTILSAVGSSTLDAQRSEMAGRVKAFIKQAEEFHPLDLAAAAEMAQRARVLAEDLEKRSK
ncbi:MAG: hypothetical protein ABI693_12735 [Bryobacteraceae bacterium]